MRASVYINVSMSLTLSRFEIYPSILGMNSVGNTYRRHSHDHHTMAQNADSNLVQA